MKKVTTQALAEKLYAHCDKNPNEWSTENIRWAWRQVFVDLNGELDGKARYFRLSEDRYDKILGIGFRLAEDERNKPTKEQEEINTLKEEVGKLRKLVAVLADVVADNLEDDKYFDKREITKCMKELGEWC